MSEIETYSVLRTILDEIGLDDSDVQENTGSHGEMVYSYFLEIPDNVDNEALISIEELTGIELKPGTTIDISTSVYAEKDENDDY